VAGISRSGKSSTIEAFAKTRDFVHIRASFLLQKANRPLGPLSRDEAVENQRVLVELLRNGGHIANPQAILDGHATIETIEGIYPVPDALFDEIRPSKIICIVSEPATLARRRADAGLILNPQDVIRLQEIEELHARVQATRLRIPFYKTEGDNLAKFAIAIEQ
jgi:adenylate kinase